MGPAAPTQAAWCSWHVALLRLLLLPAATPCTWAHWLPLPQCAVPMPVPGGICSCAVHSGLHALHSRHHVTALKAVEEGTEWGPTAAKCASAPGAGPATA
jgi:hypothetical protein